MGVPPQQPKHGARVLLVDDDRFVLEAHRRCLCFHFDVQCVRSGEAALSLMAKSADPFAVVVTDMGMPGMDGLTLLKRARLVAPDTVLILLTGSPDSHAAMGAVNEGLVYRSLAKPCTGARLIEVLREAVLQHTLKTAG